MMRRCWFILLGLSCVGSAQVNEELRVVLRDIRVHVLNENGEPVRGLTREDFLLFEDRIPRDITFFEEVDLNEIAATEQESTEVTNQAGSRKGRSIIILFDSGNLMPAAFEGMIATVDQFIKNDITPNDLIKIVHLDDRLRHLTGFTKDKALLRSALERIEYKGDMINRLRILESNVVRSFDTFYNYPDHTESFRNQKSDLANEVFEAIWEKERAKLDHYQTFHQNALIMSQIMKDLPGSKMILNFTGGGYIQSAGRFRNTFQMANKLGEELNAANVTLYSFLHTDKQPIGFAEVNNSAANLDDSAANWRFLQEWANFEDYKRLPYVPGGNRNTFLENDFQIQTTPFTMSEITGGYSKRTFVTENMPESFQNFVSATKHYYRLGYLVEPEKRVSKVQIKIPKADKKWDIRYGKRFKRPEPFERWDDTERQVSFEVGLLYSESFRNDLNCIFGFNTFSFDGEKLATAVYAGLPIDTFPKSGYEIGFAILSKNKDVLDMTRDRLTKAPPENHLLPYNVLISEVRPVFVRFYLRNMDDGDISIHEKAVEPVPDQAQTLAIPDLAFCVEDNRRLIPINHARSSEQAEDQMTRTRVELDPFLIGREMIKPNPDNLIPTADHIRFFFHLSNVSGPVQKFQMSYVLWRNGEAVPVDGALQLVHEVKENAYRCIAVIRPKPENPLGRFPAGEYQFLLKVTDPETNQVALIGRSFEVVQDLL